jgi:HPt (histidine-containing phosphotransfer) domain-containing protein
MNDYISKPLHYQTMYATLARWTHRDEPPAGPSAAEVKNTTPSVLDTDGAIARMGGESLYLSMLGKFIPSQGQSVQSIQDALAINDQATTERLVHTLKGVAATIGATSLTESVSQLEQAIKAKDAKEYPQLIEATTSKLRLVVASIETYLEEHKLND